MMNLPNELADPALDQYWTFDASGLPKANRNAPESVRRAVEIWRSELQGGKEPRGEVVSR